MNSTPLSSTGRYLSGLLPGLTQVTRSYSQIVLQQHALCGTALMLAIACNDLLQLACSLLGIIGAYWERGSGPRQREQGLQGYNGAVIGLALPALGLPPALALPLSLSGGYVSAGLLRMFSPRLPALTMPFVLVMLCLSPWLQGGAAMAPQVTAPQVTDPLQTHSAWLMAPLMGIGQILFLDAPLAATLAVLALVLSSPVTALWALVGSTVGMLCAALAGFEEGAVLAGQFGFSPALAALALSLYFRRCWARIAGGILASTAVELALAWLNLGLYTMPFILSVWLFTGLFRGAAGNGSPTEAP